MSNSMGCKGRLIDGRSKFTRRGWTALCLCALPLMLGNLACQERRGSTDAHDEEDGAAESVHGMAPENRAEIEEAILKIARELRAARSENSKWAIGVDDLVSTGVIDRSTATLGTDGIAYHASYGPVPASGPDQEPFTRPGTVWSMRDRIVLWVDPAAVGGVITCVYSGRGEIEWITVEELSDRQARFDAEQFRALEDLGHPE